MTDLATRTLTTAEAEALTDRIRESAELLFNLLLESYDRGAWSALGYSSWREYATTEFNISQSRAYQLLDQARVIAAIEAATGSTKVEITEAEARDIKPRLAEFVEDVRGRVADAPDEDRVRALVEQAVEEYRDEKQRAADDLAERRARFHKFYDDNPHLLPKFVPTVPCPHCDGSGRLPKEDA